MSKDNRVYYDEGDDSLTFISGSSKAKYSVSKGLFILSFNEKDELVAVEFMGAHEKFEIPKKVLKNLKKAELKVKCSDQKNMIIKMQLHYSKQQDYNIVTSVENESAVCKNQMLKATVSA